MPKTPYQKVRTPNIIVLCLIILIHFIFVSRLLFENSKWIPAYIICFLVIGILVCGYWYVIPKFSHLSNTIRLRNNEDRPVLNISSDDWYSVFSCMVGAVVTFFLSVNLNLGAVLGAAIVGVLSSFLPDLNQRNELLKKIPFSVYCGSFAGMTAEFILDDLYLVAIAGLIAGFIFVAAKNILIGVGGRLGTFAFISVCIVYVSVNYIF